MSSLFKGNSGGFGGFSSTFPSGTTFPTPSFTGVSSYSVGASTDWYNLGGPGVANYEKATADWSGNIFRLYTNAGGTGSVREFEVGYSGGTWRFGQGSYYPTADNFLDLGIAANRVKTVYVSTSIDHVMGIGAGTSLMLGISHRNTTAVGNVGAGTDDLMTYSLPLNSLSSGSKGVRISAWGTTANNANAKTLTLNFGSVAILTNALTASITGVWCVEAIVLRTGVDAQDAISKLITTGTAGVALNDVEFTTLTEDDGAAITIKCTGTATSDNDIVQQGLLVEFLN